MAFSVPAFRSSLWASGGAVMLLGTATWPACAQSYVPLFTPPAGFAFDVVDYSPNKQGGNCSSMISYLSLPMPPTVKAVYSTTGTAGCQTGASRSNWIISQLNDASTIGTPAALADLLQQWRITNSNVHDPNGIGTWTASSGGSLPTSSVTMTSPNSNNTNFTAQLVSYGGNLACSSQAPTATVQGNLVEIPNISGTYIGSPEISGNGNATGATTPGDAGTPSSLGLPLSDMLDIGLSGSVVVAASVPTGTAPNPDCGSVNQANVAIGFNMVSLSPSNDGTTYSSGGTKVIHQLLYVSLTLFHALNENGVAVPTNISSNDAFWESSGDARWPNQWGMAAPITETVVSNGNTVNVFNGVNVSPADKTLPNGVIINNGSAISLTSTSIYNKLLTIVSEMPAGTINGKSYQPDPDPKDWYITGMWIGQGFWGDIQASTTWNGFYPQVEPRG